MQIDRIEQIICTKNLDLKKIKSNNYFSITLKKNNQAILTTNPGKMINRNLNLGAYPIVAELINFEILKLLKIKVIKHQRIEYCIDIETPFKLINNKHIINVFYKILRDFNYNCGKLDFTPNDKNSIQTAYWKGIKGYKCGRTIKLYSKWEEQRINLNSDTDLLRLEISFGKRVIFQNKIKNISDIKKPKEELLEIILFCEKNYLKRINRYSKNTQNVISLLKQKLIKTAI